MVPLPVVRNPKYSDGCPASRMYHFHGYSGSGKSIMALSLVDGRIKADKDLADIAFACTACGLCDVSCKFIMEAERHLVNIALREHIVDEGFGPSIHEVIAENIRNFGHPRADHIETAMNWAEGLGLKMLPDQRADILLFAGCFPLHDNQSVDTTRKLARLLQRAGVDVGILGGAEPCCGLPAYWTGHRDIFKEVAGNMASLVDALGVRTIVTACGSCFGTLRSKYPEYHRALRAEVLHSSQVLAQLISMGKLDLPKQVRQKVTYHDPCYLGRQSEPPLQWEGKHKISHGCMTYTDPPKPINRGVNGVFDEPRKIITSINGVDFVEMHRIREYAFCCGGGGGVPDAYPKLAKAAAEHRIEEASDSGADVIVTSCHRCRRNLLDSQEAAGSDRMPVVDIIDLVYEAANL